MERCKLNTGQCSEGLMGGIGKRLLAVLLLWSPIVSNVRTDTTAELGRICSHSEQCATLGPDLWCHPQSHNCTCRGSLLWVASLHRCSEAVPLKEECQATEQCVAYDRHSYCGEFGRAQLPPKICQCQFGYDMKERDKQVGCIEIPNAFGTPLFDSRDTVPIVMGCLAAGLALVACCAGIVQLLRIKHRSGGRAQQDPREAVVLNLSHMLHPYSDMPFPFTACNGTSAVPTGLYGTPAGPDQPDLPPSYEEAIKDTPIIPPPYEERRENKPDE
ncbi:uncharacterized protein LOC135377227 [Ornithodoros turicata]|uniref:uncharacterized protein LOC135377227 n=1 Tax=Ornithodoros turicata TaxID=34597 RepID=UPI003138D36E